MACLLLFIRTSTAEGQQIFADKGVAATDMAYAYLNLGLEGYWGKGKPILWSEKCCVIETTQKVIIVIVNPAFGSGFPALLNGVKWGRKLKVVLF